MCVGVQTICSVRPKPRDSHYHFGLILFQVFIWQADIM